MSMLQPGAGYGFTSGGYGFTLNTENPFNDDATSIPPLTPFLDGNKITVTPGTVNRYIPLMGSTYIDAATPPNITIASQGYVCVKATYEAGKFFPRTAIISFEAGESPPADTNTQSCYPIARINAEVIGESITLSMIRLVEPGNLSVNRLKAGANNATWWWTRL